MSDPIRAGSLCTGFGGIELGLELAGESLDLRWLSEIDPALDPLHPAGVPNLGDMKLVDWSAMEPVDLLTAGFPCQPVSAAGRQLAQADERWLWPEVLRCINSLPAPPRRVLLENVRNLISIQKGEVWRHILADLTKLGYNVRWLTLGACAVGAAHHRHRVFALAALLPAAADREDAHHARLTSRDAAPGAARSSSRFSRRRAQPRPAAVDATGRPGRTVGSHGRTVRVTASRSTAPFSYCRHRRSATRAAHATQRPAAVRVRSTTTPARRCPTCRTARRGGASPTPSRATPRFSAPRRRPPSPTATARHVSPLPSPNG